MEARLIGDVTAEDVIKLADIVKRVLKLMSIVDIDCYEIDILKDCYGAWYYFL